MAMIQPHEQRVEMVAACTVAAAHRRDHQHTTHAQECHPHAVEVIHLGHRAAAICHDCHADSGFLPDRDAELLAERHIEETRGTESVPLVAVA
jgi:hypothetical protein